jgi:hypothetical protein
MLRTHSREILQATDLIFYFSNLVIRPANPDPGLLLIIKNKVITSTHVFTTHPFPHKLNKKFYCRLDFQNEVF